MSIPESMRSHDPLTRVILLGASNLTRGCHTVVQLVEQACPGDVDLMAAWGRGRSYGWWSAYCGRSLPGISECRLWSDWAARSAAPTFALVTDVGNDLLYGAEVATIASWVETCLQRLEKQSARTLLTLLPLKNIEKLSERRFEFFRRLFFPSRPITLGIITDRARRLDVLLRHSGARYGATLIEPRADWYGLDPIHLRMSRWEPAWREIFSGWVREKTADFPLKTSLSRWLRLHTQPPARRKLWGLDQQRAQPRMRWSARTWLSLY